MYLKVQRVICRTWIYMPFTITFVAEPGENIDVYIESFESYLSSKICLSQSKVYGKTEGILVGV